MDKLDLDDDCKTIPPYLKSDWPYGYKVTKEHIGHTCRVCSFHWRTDILPNAPDERPGANIKALAEAMGHAQITTTEGYCHADALSVESPLDQLT